MFDYDGFYRLSTITREATFSEYSQELQRSLLSSLNYASAQKGWQAGDRVRLIFHTSTPLKNLEISAVKNLVNLYLPEYIVDFAFLEISQFHDWVVFDPTSSGYTMTNGTNRGKQVPKRGTSLYLGDQKALLSVTGPKEMKFYDQGCPRPLQIILHQASTFQDMVYLVNQVFGFTHMSWKTFNALPMPVTIQYSESIARLLGRFKSDKKLEFWCPPNHSVE